MAVDLTLAKQHLRVEHSDEDDLITSYLNAAKEWVEAYTGKLLTSQSVEQVEACFPTFIELLSGPVSAVTEVAYTDSDDAPATLGGTRLVGKRLYAPETGWPSIAEHTPITITYTAGFSTVPVKLDQATLLLVGEYYLNRELDARSAISAAAESLCQPHRDIRI